MYFLFSELRKKSDLSTEKTYNFKQNSIRNNYYFLANLKFLNQISNF